MPIEWIKTFNEKFLINLAKTEEKQAIDILQELIEKKKDFFEAKKLRRIYEN